jgi:hypothetical protein
MLAGVGGKRCKSEGSTKTEGELSQLLFEENEHDDRLPSRKGKEYDRVEAGEQTW